MSINTGMSVKDLVKSTVSWNMSSKNLCVSCVKDKPQDKILHRKVLDFYMIVNIRHHIDKGEHESDYVNIIVTKDMYKSWGFSDSDMDIFFDKALTNTRKLFPESIYPFTAENLLKGIDAFDISNIVTFDSLKGRDSCIVTNKDMYKGFPVLLYPGFLYNLANALSSNRLFIIPSSVHEAIILSEHYSKNCDIASINEWVMCVNSQIEREIVISDHAYMWDYEKYGDALFYTLGAMDIVYKIS